MMTDQFKFDNLIIPGSIWDKESDFTVPIVSPVGAGPKGEKGDPAFFKLADPIEWASNRKYEAYTLVLHEGNSYASRQFVPAGIDIDDERFWVATGNYNAQVEQYRQEVLSYENTIRVKAFAFDKVADMQSNANITVGSICHTNGFNAVNDNGAAWYVISDTGTANGMDVIACGELFAHLVKTAETIPEQLGADGSGNTDCTSIIQYMLDEFDNFKACRESVYKCKTIYINDGGKTIDFNGCKIICDAPEFIKCENNFAQLLYTGEYIANKDTGFDTGTGLVYVHSDELAHYGREYYFGGMVCYSNIGYLSCSMPYSLDNCTIEGQSKDISNVTIKNIGDITFTTIALDETYRVINIDGVHDFLIENVNFSTSYYYGICVSRCANVIIRDCHIEMIQSGSSLVNTYGIGIINGCTYCNIANCNIYNDFWHCITTGGNETNLHTTIENCMLKISPNASSIAAYLDHGNTIDTNIFNCHICGNVSISDGSIKNCSLESPYTDNDLVQVMLSGFVGTKYHSKYVFDNIVKNGLLRFNTSIDARIGNNLEQIIDSVIIKNINKSNRVVFSVQSTTPSEFLGKFAILNEIVSNVSNFENRIGSLVNNIFIDNCTVVNLGDALENYQTLFASAVNERNIKIINCIISSLMHTGNFSYNTIAISNSHFTNETASRFNCIEKCIVTGCLIDGGIRADLFALSAIYYFDNIAKNYNVAFKAANETTYQTKLTQVDNWVSHTIS